MSYELLKTGTWSVILGEKYYAVYYTFNYKGVL